MQHPDALPLPQADAVTDAMRSTLQARAQPLQTLTAPISNTKIAEESTYCCTVPFASMHRTDGKKLPFVRGYLKTNIAEDIRFLEQEIAAGNPYIRRGTEEDIVAADLVYNPMAAVEHRVRKQITGELRAELEAEIRAEMQAQATGVSDATKLAGVDGVNVGMHGQTTIQVPKLNPVSSSDLAGGAAGSNQDVAGIAAARLAAIHGKK